MQEKKAWSWWSYCKASTDGHNTRTDSQMQATQSGYSGVLLYCCDISAHWLHFPVVTRPLLLGSSLGTCSSGSWRSWTGLDPLCFSSIDSLQLVSMVAAHSSKSPAKRNFLHLMHRKIQFLCLLINACYGRYAQCTYILYYSDFGY